MNMVPTRPGKPRKMTTPGKPEEILAVRKNGNPDVDEMMKHKSSRTISLKLRELGMLPLGS